MTASGTYRTEAVPAKLNQCVAPLVRVDYGSHFRAIRHVVTPFEYLPVPIHFS